MSPRPEITWPQAAEFAERRARLLAAAQGEGMDALLLVARGGGTADRYANVKYATDFYTSFPYIPDEEGHWSGRGHAFVLIAPDGASTLVADMHPDGDGVAHVDSIIVEDDGLGTLAKVIADAGLSRATIGLVGADILPVSAYRKLHAALPGVSWPDADALMNRVRMVKSAAEITLMHHASWVGSRAIDAMLDAVEVGVSHRAIMKIGFDKLTDEAGLLYNSFIGSGRGGNDPKSVYHSFPTFKDDTPVEAGEWFHIGLSGVVNGYYFDLARSKPVGHSTAPEIESFEAAIAVVEAGIGAIRPGKPVGVIAEAAFAKQQALDFPMSAEFAAMGHGVGMGWDSPWLTLDSSETLQPGMVLCVERGLSRQGYVGDFEETVVVTENGARLLTDAVKRRW
jgi:Xaa-Pro aminopeptidase